MGTMRMFGLALLVGAMAMTGCKNKEKEQISLLTRESEDLRAQLDDRNAALESANMELRDKTLQLTRLERGERSSGLGADGAGGDNPFANIEGVTGSVSGGEVTASVSGDVLFDSGKTTLKPAAKQSLEQVAGVLNSQFGGWMIRIVGHTDTDPIKKSKFATNYHLGFERAYAVREFLISKGIPSARIQIASSGPDQPLGSKPQSRRVEIVARRFQESLGGVGVGMTALGEQAGERQRHAERAGECEGDRFVRRGFEPPAPVEDFIPRHTAGRRRLRRLR